jgi:hypothetical protein
MNKILTLLLIVIQTINLNAQPGPHESNAFINDAAYSKPFLHCVTDEKYFAKYVTEAHTGSFYLTESLKCKLHIPTGINKIWKDAENSKVHKKGEYDYSNDFWIKLRFNFYIGGVLVSSALENFKKPQQDAESFTFYFDLNPLHFEQKLGNINEAYLTFLKNIKKKGSQLVIEATLPSKNATHNSYIPIASSSFYLRYDDSTYQSWKKSSTNYNIKLKQLADSTMKSIFGEKGFATNFNMSCLQNPCAKGYLYANTLVSNNPCASEPQDSCKEAIVTYNYVKKDVPLTIKMLITIKENGEIVYIENNPFGKKPISIEKQNLLSIPEIQKIITRQFPKDSLIIFSSNKVLAYSNTRIQQPEYKDEGNKLNSNPGKKLIKVTNAGKKWENGFIYTAISHDPKKAKRIYQFDAVTGKLLLITEIFKVTNEDHSH